MAFSVSGAFAVYGGSEAQAQGSPTCSVEFVDGPILIDDPPAPTPVPTATPAPPESDDTVVVGSAAAVAESEAIIVTDGCAAAIAYPGPFTNMPIVPASPYAASGSTVPAQSTDAASSATADTSPSGSDLAHSGSEIVVLAYLGTGMLAFGAVAMGVRRGGLVE